MISNKLVELRKSKGWGQQVLANKTGISRVMISRYEHGASPRKRNLELILKAFGLPKDYFFKLTTHKKSSSPVKPLNPLADKLLDIILGLPKKDQEAIVSLIEGIEMNRKKTKIKAKSKLRKKSLKLD
jgi:transcriptional regulator with XRE-family HTH domain